jgi:CheY-like chemotaxis protein
MSDHQPRILLLAEDDPDMAFLISRACGRMLSGWEICHVREGASALLRMQETPAPDALITDLHMPGMDGFALLEQIQKVHAWGSLPIFVLTASIEPTDEDRCAQLGANGFFSKDPAEIRRSLFLLGRRFDRKMELPGVASFLDPVAWDKSGMGDARHEYKKTT